MPIYDYQCSSCGFKKEVMRKISEPNLTACPECGKETFTKQLSAPSFQLSGSGWYATDFKNSGAKKPETKPDTGAAETKTGSQAEPKEVSKAEPKKEASASAGTSASCATGCACH